MRQLQAADTTKVTEEFVGTRFLLLDPNKLVVSLGGRFAWRDVGSLGAPYHDFLRPHSSPRLNHLKQSPPEQSTRSLDLL